MEQPHLIIQFKGADADRHHLDMRRMGEALIGFQRIISVGLFVLEVGRYPKHRESLPITVRATGPKSGSIEFLSWVEVTPSLLPLLHEVSLAGASELIWRWTSCVLHKIGGRTNDANKNMSKLIELIDKLDERKLNVITEMHERDMNVITEMHGRNMNVLERAINRLSSASRQVVSPVGHSCDQIDLSSPKKDEWLTTIDHPMADAIRSKQKLEVSDMKQMCIKVDGFSHHNRQLKVVHPDDPDRFITARVRDPAFNEAPNIYTEAATMEKELNASVKITTNKDGRLVGLYVMDARPVEE